MDLRVAELEFKRECYVKLLEQAETTEACRRYLRKITKVEAEIEALSPLGHDPGEGPLIEVPLALQTPTVREGVVEVELADADPDHDGVEIELVAGTDEDLMIDDDGDFLDTMDTVVYLPGAIEPSRVERRRAASDIE